MLSIIEIKKIIQDSLDGLQQSGVIEKVVEADDNTVLLGSGSALDSIAFVTLFMDIEDRILSETGEEFYLLIDEIHEFNHDKKQLSLGTLIDYIDKKRRLLES